ncbi:A-kinase-interacting protein 1 [Tiliqua scincoides]|uniref:A-kinase-interacting protein 1 n=1 Tax=Tiliqua scincoides TaxID=71010 RepID=UPI003461D017
MESRTISVNHHLMQRTATLAREVLERAKTRKLNWPLPSRFQSKTFREVGQEDACLEAAFASVAEHMGRISEECENYYCCVPPFQFKEYEVAHIFRYHSRQASENLLKAFRDEESKASPVVEQPRGTEREILTLLPADSAELLPTQTSNQKADSGFTCPGWFKRFLPGMSSISPQSGSGHLH